MASEISILRALRNRSTIIQEIAKAQERAQTNAVLLEDDNVDFNIENQLEIHASKQHELRTLKVAVSIASLSNMVDIPKCLSQILHYVL